MEDKIPQPIYVLVVKEENLEAIRLYLHNLKSLGLIYESVPGITVDAVFIKLFLSELAAQHFSEIYNIGVTDKKKRFRFDGLEPISLNMFTTPVSQLPPRQDGQLFSCEMVMIVHKLLEATKFSHRDGDRGLSKLIRIGVVMDGYPLHEGPAALNGYNDRSLLLRFWSNITLAHREQPLDLVQRYFGNEIAFYFAWLQFFTTMLIPASILGAVVFVISLVRVTLFNMPEVEEICNDNDRYVCPTCEHRPHCSFRKLSDFCSLSKWTYVFDNYFTVGFAVFMSFWATLLLTSWHRKQNKLRLRWTGTLETELLDLKVRTLYKESTKRRRYNLLTGKLEPYVPKFKTVLNYCISSAVCTIIIVIMLFSVSLNIITGIEVRSLIDMYGNADLKANKVSLAMVLGSFIQVVYIKLMSLVFGPLSIKLTNLENPPTQRAFDNSVLYKRYILAFVNNLAPLFYLAFVKGKVYTVPHNNNIYLTQDVCQPQSCIVALCIQLTFLLTLRSFAGNVINLIIPKIKLIFHHIFRKKSVEAVELPPWEEEYFMEPTGRYLLTTEFSEMIIKFCLVTFFVGAFPLAPLCALINNLIETRSDAFKLVVIYRRPIPMRTTGIGAWNGILLCMTYISTVTNAFVIAFTSDFIADQIFHFHSDMNINGYYNFLLSKYATKDYPPFTKLENSVETCVYRGHYNPPNSTEPYHRDTFYWFNFSAMFIGVLIFEHIVLFSNILLAYFTPKIPATAKQEIVWKKFEKRDKTMKNLVLNARKGDTIDQILKLRP